MASSENGFHVRRNHRVPNAAESDIICICGLMHNRRYYRFSAVEWYASVSLTEGFAQGHGSVSTAEKQNKESKSMSKKLVFEQIHVFAHVKHPKQMIKKLSII